MANKVDELLSAAKLNELFHKKQLEEKNKKKFMDLQCHLY